MKQAFLLLLVAIGLFSLTGCNKTLREFNLFCSLIEKVESDRVTPPQYKAVKLARSVVKAGFSKKFTKTMRKLAVLPPKQKYSYLLKQAKKQGLESWACPAARRLFEK